jgi:DNA-binding NarL/FixJ family response regulator
MASKLQIIVEAVRLIYAGQKVMEKSIQAQIEKSPIRSQKILAAKASLTSREKQILQMIADGYTDPKIAETLFLSGNTIRHYRDTLLLKLDVNNTAAMVSKALKLGLVH